MVCTTKTRHRAKRNRRPQNAQQHLQKHRFVPGKMDHHKAQSGFQGLEPLAAFAAHHDTHIKSGLNRFAFLRCTLIAVSAVACALGTFTTQPAVTCGTLALVIACSRRCAPLTKGSSHNLASVATESIQVISGETLDAVWQCPAAAFSTGKIPLNPCLLRMPGYQKIELQS